MLLSPVGSQRRVMPASRSEQSVQKMVGTGRVELPTSRLSVVRSNHLSYAPVTLASVLKYRFERDSREAISVILRISTLCFSLERR